MVVKHCAYATCKSDSRDFKKPHMKNITFFRFPNKLKFPIKCEKWVNACNRDGFTIAKVTSYTFICSRHFHGGEGPTKDYPDPISATCSDTQKRNSRKRLADNSKCDDAEPKLENRNDSMPPVKKLSLPGLHATPEPRAKPKEVPNQSNTRLIVKIAKKPFKKLTAEKSTQTFSIRPTVQEKASQITPEQTHAIIARPNLKGDCLGNILKENSSEYDALLRKFAKWGWFARDTGYNLVFLKIQHNTVEKEIAINLQTGMHSITLSGNDLVINPNGHLTIIKGIKELEAMLRTLEKTRVCAGSHESEFISYFQNNKLDGMRLCTKTNTLRNAKCRITCDNPRIRCPLCSRDRDVIRRRIARSKTLKQTSHENGQIKCLKMDQLRERYRLQQLTNKKIKRILIRAEKKLDMLLAEVDSSPD